MHYSTYVDLFKYDEGISCHPYIDACNASIIYRLLESVGMDGSSKSILDAGSGSGQVVRLLQGIPFLKIDACDIDIGAQRFFKDNPETADVQYYCWDIINDKFDKFYDAIIIRGVYHHIPKGERPKLLLNLCTQAKVVINADEGILEYNNPQERLENCEIWYNYVIGEAKRRRVIGLAEMEANNLNHERLHTADDGGDYKESPSDLISDAKQVSLQVPVIDRQGNWNVHRGGFYTAIIKKDGAV